MVFATIGDTVRDPVEITIFSSTYQSLMKNSGDFTEEETKFEVHPYLHRDLRRPVIIEGKKDAGSKIIANRVRKPRVVKVKE